MHKVVKGIVWKTLQQYGSFFIKLIVQIVLARLLLPEQFGLISKVLAIVVIAETLANSGLGIALIQKVNSDTHDYSTVFAGSMGFSLILYVMMFISAPAIAAFFGEQEIVKILRIYGTALFFTSFNSIQNAYILKKCELKGSFIASLLASIFSGIVSVVMAVLGLGVWAIIAQSLLYLIINSVVLQLLIDWKPHIEFSFSRFKRLFSFAWKIMVSSLLGITLENIYNLSIGKLYSNEVLGYYNRGNSFPSIIVGQLSSSIKSVTLPWFVESQDNRETLLQSIKKVTHLSALIIFPIATGIACAATSLIKVLLTEKWLPCVFFLRIECIFYGTLVISSSIGNAIIAVRRSDIVMLLESLKLAALFLCIIFLNKYGINVLCFARIVVAVGIILVSVFITRRLFKYTLKNVFQDIYKPLFLCVVMGIAVYAASKIIQNDVLSLLIQILIGICVYAAGVFIFMREDVAMLKTMLFKKTK